MSVQTAFTTTFHINRSHLEPVPNAEGVKKKQVCRRRAQGGAGEERDSGGYPVPLQPGKTGCCPGRGWVEE